MKYGSFSDAIRAGAKLRPQGYGYFLQEGRSCAFGAGREAACDPDAHYSEVYRMYPYLDVMKDQSCPVCQPFTVASHSLASIMFHLNDDHRWTREQIADWLQQEEDKLGYETITEPEVVEKEYATCKVMKKS